jgi:NAD(P)-dependent dehydrogenase (short-subunit alcohol dehydrogenase family)
MSKAALNAFTQTLAKEVGASGITVNAIAPGLVLTDRIQNERLPGMASKAGVTPNQMLEQLTKGTVTSRLTTEDDIAEATLFLASEGAAAITGQILDVSSGV